MDKWLLAEFVFFAFFLIATGIMAQDYGYYEGLREFCPEPNIIVVEEGELYCKPFEDSVPIYEWGVLNGE